VACVCVGDKYGDHYVHRLRNMVARNLGPHRFVCLSDQDIEGIDCLPAPDLPGWWAKLGIFRGLPVEYPLLYLDLDMLVTGDLRPLGNGEAFCTIRQWKRIVSAKTVPVYNSSAMLLAAPQILAPVWDEFTPAAMSEFRGDQDWLAHLYPDLPTWPGEWFAAMERCKAGPPADCRLVLCNMLENEDAARECSWVEEIWC
jgi:hypothetical protein